MAKTEKAADPARVVRKTRAAFRAANRVDAILEDMSREDAHRVIFWMADLYGCPWLPVGTNNGANPLKQGLFDGIPPEAPQGTDGLAEMLDEVGTEDFLV